jgi:hypothetical protein
MEWVLYFRHGCGLCDELKDELDTFIQHLPHTAKLHYQLVDIDTDQGLRKKYNEDVPLLMHGDKIVLKYFFDESLLRKVLKL